jgi:hypothetical protein
VLSLHRYTIWYADTEYDAVACADGVLDLPLANDSGVHSRDPLCNLGDRWLESSLAMAGCCGASDAGLLSTSDWLSPG